MAIPARRWVRRVLASIAIVALVLFLTTFGYEVVDGSKRPIQTLVRRGDTALRHVGMLPPRSFGSYEEGTGGAEWGETSASGEFVKTGERITTREPSYTLGIWPTGLQVSVRELRHAGPLELAAYRLVWWDGDERHVVDTADRTNGRLPAGARSVEVRGWIPFEASRWGAEKLEDGDAPDAWREEWSEGFAE